MRSINWLCKDMTGTIFDIQRFCVHDGPGIRTTVFMKGCPLRCGWCHNPEGLSGQIHVQFFREECIRCGSCSGEKRPEDVPVCPTGALRFSGRQIDEAQLLEALVADREFYGDEGGVTFSGGECLLQGDFVAQLLKKLKALKINTAIDTCGCVPWEQIAKTLPFCDLYLYDIKCADGQLHRNFTGQDNRLILENLRKLSQQGKRIWIRVPIIPGFNDAAEELEAIAAIAAGTAGVTNVTLMPYHTLGKSKYETLGLTPAYDAPRTVTPEQLQAAKEIFRKAGLPVEE